MMNTNQWSFVAASELNLKSRHVWPDYMDSFRCSPTASNGCRIVEEPNDWYTVIHPDGHQERLMLNVHGVNATFKRDISEAAREAILELSPGSAVIDGGRIAVASGLESPAPLPIETLDD